MSVQHSASLRTLFSSLQTNQNVLTQMDAHTCVSLISNEKPQKKNSPMWCNHFQRYSHHASLCKSGGSQQYAASVQTQRNPFFGGWMIWKQVHCFMRIKLPLQCIVACKLYQVPVLQFCLKRECSIHCCEVMRFWCYHKKTKRSQQHCVTLCIVLCCVVRMK